MASSFNRGFEAQIQFSSFLWFSKILLRFLHCLFRPADRPASCSKLKDKLEQGELFCYFIMKRYQIRTILISRRFYVYSQKAPKSAKVGGKTPFLDTIRRQLARRRRPNRHARLGFAFVHRFVLQFEAGASSQTEPCMFACICAAGNSSRRFSPERASEASENTILMWSLKTSPNALTLLHKIFGNLLTWHKLFKSRFRIQFWNCREAGVNQ